MTADPERFIGTVYTASGRTVIRQAGETVLVEVIAGSSELEQSIVLQQSYTMSEARQLAALLGKVVA